MVERSRCHFLVVYKRFLRYIYVILVENTQMPPLQQRLGYKSANPDCANCNRCKSTVFIKTPSLKSEDVELKNGHVKDKETFCPSGSISKAE